MAKVQSTTVTDEQLAVALEEAHQSDAPEIELLREVAFNDVVLELNRKDELIQLSRMQRFLAALA